MRTDIPNLEPTPEPATPYCRLLAQGLGLMLSYGTYLVGLLFWWIYDWFYAIAGLLAGFVVLGIVRAKIRNSAIPLQQLEYTYTDHAIAKWFIVRRMLCGL